MAVSGEKTEDYFNTLLDPLVRMLNRLRTYLFLAAAPDMNVLITALDEQAEHLGDFSLSFQKIPCGGTVLLADSHGENAGIS
jgi:hypothetical protein